jgi:ectoine hydroxylase-related dioxygenase (phytanoyl-CoA dioxygenase family)
MNDGLLTLSREQKSFFDDHGFLHLPGFYSGQQLQRLRDEYHQLVTHTDERPANLSYSYMDPAEGYPPDDYNPKNVVGMMDQVMASDFWIDHFTEPRLVGAMVDCLGQDLDFHNGKVRNKPPGFESTQGWHQDWPYELHSKPELAAAITYLDPTDFEAGATEVIPQSHLAALPTEEDKSTLIQQDVDESKAVVCKADAGDVVVIHVLVVHRAGHNFTERSRNAIINEYKSAGAIDKWNNRCALAGMPLARGGRQLMPRLTDW